MSDQLISGTSMPHRISAESSAPSLENLTIGQFLRNATITNGLGHLRLAQSADRSTDVYADDATDDKTGGDANAVKTPGDASARNSGDPAAHMLAEVQQEMRAHSQATASRGYISTLADMVYRKDERSFQNLQAIEQSLQQNGLTGASDQAKITKAIEDDKKALGTQNTISGVTSTIAKVAPLFMKGSFGWAGTIAANALEQAKPSESFDLQLVDGIMGATKGAALKGTFSMLPEAMPSYGKGALLGASSRFLEVGLDRHTYIDSQGNMDLEGGVMNTFQTALNPKAIAIDAATFAVAGAAVGGVNYATKGLIARSPFLATVTTGSVFGFSTGASTEFFRQRENNENMNIGKMWGAGFSSALISGIASIPGGLQAQASLNAERQKVLQEMLKADKSRPEPLLPTYETKDTGRLTLNGRDLDQGIYAELARPEYTATTIAKDGNNFILRPGLDTNTSVNGEPIAKPRVLKSGDVIKTTTYSAVREGNVERVITWTPEGDGTGKGVFGTANLGEASWEPTFAQKNHEGKIMLHVGSRTNTTVNGEPLERGQVVEIKPGDKITTKVNKVAVEAPWGTEKIDIETQPRAWITDSHGEEFDLTDNFEFVEGGRGTRSMEIGADSKGIYMYDMGISRFFAPDRMRINGKPFLPTEKVYVSPFDKITNNGKPWNFGIDAGEPEVVRSNTRQFWQ